MTDRDMKIQHDVAHDLLAEFMPNERPDWSEVIADLDYDNCYQLRITQSWDDVKGHLTKILDRTPFYFVFQHNADRDIQRTHIHAYLFNCSYAGISIRTHLKSKDFKGNSDFSLSQKAGKGREPLTIEGAYRYGTTVDLDPPVAHHGFDAQMLEYLKNDAQEYYDTWRQENDLSKEEFRVVYLEKTLTAKDATWEYLYKKFHETTLDIASWSVDTFKAYICRDWLERMKALPRPSDLHRYAWSLYLLRHCIREKDWSERTIKDLDEHELYAYVQGEKLNGTSRDAPRPPPPPSS